MLNARQQHYINEPTSKHTFKDIANFDTSTTVLFSPFAKPMPRGRSSGGSRSRSGAGGGSGWAMGTILPPEYGIFRNTMNTTLRHDIQALYGPGPVRMYALFLRATLIPRYRAATTTGYHTRTGPWDVEVRDTCCGSKR